MRIICLALTAALSGCGIIYEQRKDVVAAFGGHDCTTHSVLFGAISWESCE